MLISLPHRALITFGGAEAIPFLNDLITAAIPETQDGVRPAALLTPQGRILFDLLISRQGDDILVELDRDRAEPFMKKMMMYRLRRDVTITADPRAVHVIIGDADVAGNIRDTRFTDPVYRVYGDAPTPAQDDADRYKALRYQQGIAEGSDELTPEKALPLEARLDLDHGISFEKGCYIGQEVTARTRYRGLVKRSYLPVSLTQNTQAPCDITSNGKVVGELLGCAHTQDGLIGLGSLRLDALEGDTPLIADGHPVTPQFPERLMPLPKRKDN